MANHIPPSLKPTPHFKALVKEQELFGRVVECRAGHGFNGACFAPDENLWQTLSDTRTPNSVLPARQGVKTPPAQRRSQCRTFNSAQHEERHCQTCRLSQGLKASGTLTRTGVPLPRRAVPLFSTSPMTVISAGRSGEFLSRFSSELQKDCKRCSSH